MYKVIVIEDELTVRRGIVLTTDWNSLECVVVGEAANGEEGLALVKRLAPHIVITDLKMPRMDGVEMIARLRQEGCQARFIILTAYSDFKYAQSALRLNVSDYLLKPLTGRDLEHAVLTLIRQTAQTSPSPIQSFSPKSNGKSQYVEAAVRFIHTHYQEDISISTVARELDISEGYLSRIFKRETDYTFTNYLTFYRLRLAMDLLQNRKLKIYEVADQIGYSDTAYFSVQFKKLVGISPSDYQNQNGSISL